MTIPARPATKRRVRWKRFIPLYLMMLPGVAYLIINNYMPMPGLIIAFEKFIAGRM